MSNDGVEPNAPAAVTQRRVFALWWPLAGSWLLMGVEMPALAIAMTRMPGGDAHLAALGALVYPLSLLIEAPIIMLLSASTALAKDRHAHALIRSFTHVAGAILTVIHGLVAFTGVFDWLALDVIGVPQEIVEPGRVGMQIMLPWTWAIAYRRFQQGVLIRCERSRLVAKGTLIRLIANVAVLSVGLAIGTWPAIVVGCTGVACGVVAEAVWAGYCYRTAALPCLAPAPADPSDRLTWRAFRTFYLPLAFTPFITIVIQPIGAWAMSQLGRPLASLAVWPAVYGLLFLSRSAGFAFNEVVVTLAGRPGGLRELRRFGFRIGAFATAVLLALAVTPLGGIWFGAITGLSDELTALAASAVLVGLLMPAYAVAQNYHQGVLVHERRTRAITEAVVVYLLVCSALLLTAVHAAPDWTGAYATLLAFTIAGLVQTGWLILRRRSAGPVAVERTVSP
ncbi:MAG: hypothetical protein NXI31_23465 [bacterium]|nr:hypothetical protein [bacterium]